MRLSPAQLIEGRVYLGMTQEQIADALGVTRATVNRYESGARQASEAYVKALVELCQARAAPVPPPKPTPVGFDLGDLNAPGGLKSLAKNADQIAKLPERDFESIRTRINEVISVTYDEKLKVRGLDILAKLELARAKVELPGDPARTAETDNSFDLSRLSDVELALYNYLHDKARGENQNVDLPWVKQAFEVLTRLEGQP